MLIYLYHRKYRYSFPTYSTVGPKGNCKKESDFVGINKILKRESLYGEERKGKAAYLRILSLCLERKESVGVRKRH